MNVAALEKHLIFACMHRYIPDIIRGHLFDNSGGSAASQRLRVTHNTYFIDIFKRCQPFFLVHVSITAAHNVSPSSGKTVINYTIYINI